jgi:hypothetical protein
MHVLLRICSQSWDSAYLNLSDKKSKFLGVAIFVVPYKYFLRTSHISKFTLFPHTNFNILSHNRLLVFADKIYKYGTLVANSKEYGRVKM